MATRRESWDRLVGKAWLGDATIQRLMGEKGARTQRLADGQFFLIKGVAQPAVGDLYILNFGIETGAIMQCCSHRASVSKPRERSAGL